MVTKSNPTEKIRLLVAAHELGHALVWKAAGFEVVELRVSGSERVRGWTGLDGREMKTVQETADYLTGILAGKIAGDRWCDENRIPLRAHDSCDFDQDQYRAVLKDPLAVSLRDVDLRRAARERVHDLWSKIERHAPQLAERGTLRL